MSHNNKTYKITNGRFVESYSIKKIEAKITCDACNHNIPINKISNYAKCSLCGSKNKIKEVIWDYFIDIATLEKLKCEQCNIKYDINDMLYAIENNTALVCKNCKISINSRKLPTNYISKNNFKISGVFNETLAEVNTNETNNTIKIECSNCGAPLSANESSKFVVCEFCGTNNMLSQTTLQHLNPLKTHPFYVLILNRKWDPIEEDEKKEKKKLIHDKEEISNKIKKIKKIIKGLLFALGGIILLTIFEGFYELDPKNKDINLVYIIPPIILLSIGIILLINMIKRKKLKNKLVTIDEKISKISEKINQYNKEKNLIK